MQLRANLWMWQDEYLLQGTAIYTRFKGVYRSIYCNMLLNAVRFGAKCNAFCRETRGKMLLNAMFFAAKCEEKSINIRRNGIFKTF